MKCSFHAHYEPGQSIPAYLLSFRLAELRTLAAPLVWVAFVSLAILQYISMSCYSL